MVEGSNSSRPAQTRVGGPEARPRLESEGITPQLERRSRVGNLAAAVLARDEQTGDCAPEEEDDPEGEPGANAGIAPLELTAEDVHAVIAVATHRALVRRTTGQLARPADELARRERPDRDRTPTPPVSSAPTATENCAHGEKQSNSLSPPGAPRRAGNMRSRASERLACAAVCEAFAQRNAGLESVITGIVGAPGFARKRAGVAGPCPDLAGVQGLRLRLGGMRPRGLPRSTPN